MVCWNLSCPAVVKKSSQINSTKSINMLHSWFLMQCCFSQSELSVFLDILKHLETCRPLLVLKQSCTAAEGLQPVSRKDLLATARHKHRVKTSQSYAESTSISLSPSKTPSTAGLLLWRRDGWRLHVLLLPCQCLQRKCGIVIGYINIDAWKDSSNQQNGLF